MRILSRTAVPLVSVLLAAAVALAQPAAAPPKSAPAPTGLHAELLRQIDDAEKKIVSLADAVPAEKYAWRPAPGVRSVGEVYMHIAGANYFFPTLWGVQLPSGVDPRGFEKEGGDKAKVKATLQASFAHLRHAVDTTSDLDKSIQLFGQPGKVRAAMLVAVTHLHEHLGQSIAYARMNGVVPPWSAGTGGAGR